MTPFLLDRKRLTIVTNSLEVAHRMAGIPLQTVILVGGIVRGDGGATGGVLGATALSDLHSRIAFVSGAGFAVETGLMDDDLQEAQLKRLMLDAAGYVVALVDSSQTGQKGVDALCRRGPYRSSLHRHRRHHRAD